MRRIMIVVLAIVAALGVTASTASTATTETGVTATSVKIGGTFPLSGPASLYATIPVAMKAYFSYINARRGPDGKRGVYGLFPANAVGDDVELIIATALSAWSDRSGPVRPSARRCPMSP